MQELLQEINARLSKIEKALGIRTPKTLAIGEHWTLTRLDLPYLRMVTYHQMDGYLMVCWASTNVVHPRFSAIEPATVVRLEQADGFADAKSLLDTGFRPDTTHGYLDLQQCISKLESPWPAEPIAPGPGYPEPEEIDAGMAAIEGQETPESETSVTVEVYSPERGAYVSKAYDLQPLTLNAARALVEEGEENVVCDVNNSGRYSYVSSIGTMRFTAGRTSWSIHESRKFYRAVAPGTAGTSESKVATPTETRVAKNPVPRALDITYGFKIRHHEPQVREVLVSEPGTRVTNGTKTGTIKAIGDRGIQVLWDGGLRAKWFDGTGFSVV